MRPYDERLDHLLSQAARVFAERGYHQTTMRDVAAASGMSLAGIYYYVQGKEGLLQEIQERTFSQVLEGAEHAVQSAGPDAVERLQAFIHHHIAFFASHMHEMKVLSHEAAALTGSGLERVTRIKRRYGALLGRLLLAAAPDEARVERSASGYLLFGMMNWIYTWYDPKGEINPERLATLAARIFLTGFADARSPLPSPVHGD